MLLGDRVIDYGLAALHDECDQFWLCSQVPASYAEAVSFKLAAKENGATADKSSIRRSRVTWLDIGQHVQVYQVLADLIARVNAEYFRFDLSGLGEMVQVARYDAGDKAEYGWHQDIGAEVSRKLSVTLQLSDHESYDGGDLEIFKAASQVIKADRTRGAMTVFPSYQMHRVTPIVRGTRCSLVAWVSGPPFK